MKFLLLSTSLLLFGISAACTPNNNENSPYSSQLSAFNIGTLEGIEWGEGDEQLYSLAITAARDFSCHYPIEAAENTVSHTFTEVDKSSDISVPAGLYCLAVAAGYNKAGNIVAKNIAHETGTFDYITALPGQTANVTLNMRTLSGANVRNTFAGTGDNSDATINTKINVDDSNPQSFLLGVQLHCGNLNIHDNEVFLNNAKIGGYDLESITVTTDKKLHKINVRDTSTEEGSSSYAAVEVQLTDALDSIYEVRYTQGETALNFAGNQCNLIHNPLVDSDRLEQLLDIDNLVNYSRIYNIESPDFSWDVQLIEGEGGHATGHAILTIELSDDADIQMTSTGSADAGKLVEIRVEDLLIKSNEEMVEFYNAQRQSSKNVLTMNSEETKYFLQFSEFSKEYYVYSLTLDELFLLSEREFRLSGTISRLK